MSLLEALKDCKMSLDVKIDWINLSDSDISRLKRRRIFSSRDLLLNVPNIKLMYDDLDLYTRVLKALEQVEIKNHLFIANVDSTIEELTVHNDVYTALLKKYGANSYIHNFINLSKEQFLKDTGLSTEELESYVYCISRHGLTLPEEYYGG